MLPSEDKEDVESDWDVRSQHLKSLLTYSAYFLSYFISCLITYLTFVHVCLLFRSLRLASKKRCRPSADKAIIITGATSGFGLATAKRLYSQGYTVFACFFNDQEAGYAELLELKLRFSDARQQVELGKRDGAKKAKLFLIRMDVRSRKSIEQSGKEINQLLEVYQLKLQTVINNAGISQDGPFELANCKSISDIVDTNLTGSMLVAKQFVLPIIKDKGRIVNISSGIYRFPGRALTLYGSTKCAIMYFSDSLHEDLKHYGASCCSLVPGNFFASSNILYTKIRFLQESIKQLSNEEQVTYAKTIDEFSSGMNRLLKLKLEIAHESPATIAKTYRIEIPDYDQMPTIRQRHLSLFTRLMLWFIKRVDGGSGARSLEESGLVGAFEDAVRLESTPRRIYAGNWFYSHISGPSTEYLPPILTSFMGNLLVEGMSRP